MLFVAVGPEQWRALLFYEALRALLVTGPRWPQEASHVSWEKVPAPELSPDSVEESHDRAIGNQAASDGAGLPSVP